MAFSKRKVSQSGVALAEGLSLVLESKEPDGWNYEEFEEAIEVVEWWRGAHAKPLSRVAANLRYYASEEGKPVVAQRLKKLPTIAGKLLREPKMELARMGDIGGVRAVLPDQKAADRVASRLRKNWTITKVHDYVREPKPDGYRALHLINRNHGKLIEVQLRTPNQDIWANTVETLSRTVAPGLKFGTGPQFIREYFLMTGELLAKRDQGLPVSIDLAQRVQELMKQVDTFLESLDEPR